jgi:membrane dipeptidase
VRCPPAIGPLGVAVALLLAAGACGGEAPPPPEPDPRVARVHREALLVDGHNDVAPLLLDWGFDLALDGSAPGKRAPWPWFFLPWLPGRPSAEALATDTDLARLRAGGVDAQFFSIWVAPEHYDPDEPGRARRRALALFDAVTQQARRHSEHLAIARTAADVRRIAAEGRIALLFGVEGGHAIGNDLGTLRLYFERGARYMTLTWSFSHGWAGSSGDGGGGLTEFGREVVAEMNRLGMLVDVSHVSDATFWDTIEATRAPLIASHSSARALAPHPRNLDDAMLRAVAANGGVVMVNFGGIFLDPRKVGTWSHVANALRSGFRMPTTVAMLADHVEHVARVAGHAHVGLGSDFDGTLFLPETVSDVAGFPNLSQELARRGWSDAQLRLLLGGNALRVLAEARARAAEGGP